MATTHQENLAPLPDDLPSERTSRFIEGSALTGPDPIERTSSDAHLLQSILSEMDACEARRQRQHSGSSASSGSSSVASAKEIEAAAAAAVAAMGTISSTDWASKHQDEGIKTRERQSHGLPFKTRRRSSASTGTGNGRSRSHSHDSVANERGFMVTRGGGDINVEAHVEAEAEMRARERNEGLARKVKGRLRALTASKEDGSKWRLSLVGS